MGVRIWLLMGALAGLIAGILVDVVVDVPSRNLRVAQTAMILFGALVAAFVYRGARAVTEGREPSLSTDPPHRRWVVRSVPGRPREGRPAERSSGPAAPEEKRALSKEPRPSRG